MLKKIVLGIDASRNRSGGAIGYLKGILKDYPLIDFNFEVHIWGPLQLLNQLPDRPWLAKHSHHLIEKSIFHQIFWQSFILDRLLRKHKCKILFSPDATTFCTFSPHVVMSQDLLAYEPSVVKNYKWGIQRLRLEFIKRIQGFAFKRSEGVLFLTNYASNLIKNYYGNLENIGYSPHGVDDVFRAIPRFVNFPKNQKSIVCTYISATDLYKNQWNVVIALAMLRMQGFDVELILVGGSSGEGARKLSKAIVDCNASSWVNRHEFLPHSELPEILINSDLFIFASSCENLPVTLLEGMASALPIACSDAGPMPEVLQDGGVYFNPKDPSSIAEAVRVLIESPDVRNYHVMVASSISQGYTWSSCSKKTFDFIEKSYFKFFGKQ